MKFAIVSLGFFATALAQNWNTYPQVPKTASINGFADPIYSAIPQCAQSCVKASTGNTPCPYWDTGCLCVMPQWSGQVAQCVAEQCSGEEVASVTSLALSLCSSVGANTWAMPGSISTALISAEANGDARAATATTSVATAAAATATPAASSSPVAASSAVDSSQPTSSQDAPVTSSPTSSSTSAESASSESAAPSSTTAASSGVGQTSGSTTLDVTRFAVVLAAVLGLAITV